MEGEPILEMIGISKALPKAPHANDGINFDLREGEVHALLGENGAGKTTLMKNLFGLFKPDSGTILLRGEEMRFESPSDAIARGLGMVHQHFMLIPKMTVEENVTLGIDPIRYGFLLDHSTPTQRITELSEQYNLDVGPHAFVKDLAVGLQQRVEIIKILYRNADILILDEPTSTLTPQETEALFEVIRSLAARGKSVIFITHKLREVLAIADRITVLRDGRVVGRTTPRETSESELAVLMVGREVIPSNNRASLSPGKLVLEIRSLFVGGSQGNTAVCGVDLAVYAGEIVGIIGIHGNGQTELVEALVGLRATECGEIHIHGCNTTNSSPRSVSRMGVAYIPPDRQRDGLALGMSVLENLVCGDHSQPPIHKWLGISWKKAMEVAQARAHQFDVRMPDIGAPASTLSGGNQQKLIVAREFSRPITLLAALEPTRGLDVGATEYIHQQILGKRDNGCAVLFVTSDLDEAAILSDRIAVMYEGRIVAVMSAKEATREELGLLMMGGGESRRVD